MENYKGQSARELIENLQNLKRKAHEVSEELASRIIRNPELMDALKEGLIRLNFPAPAGFYRYLNNK